MYRFGQNLYLNYKNEKKKKQEILADFRRKDRGKRRRERSVRDMKKFDVLKAITDEEKFSDMVFDLIEVKKTPEALAELLKEEMPEKELPHLKEAALNGYPLFFSGIQ